MRFLVVILLVFVSMNTLAESWELWVSQDKSKGLIFLSGGGFTVNVVSKEVTITNPFHNSKKCDSSHVKDYGVASFNGTDIKLGFTCNKYNWLSHHIETEKGMAFVYDLLLNNNSFKFKFSSPTRSYAEKTFTFPLSGAELIKSPFKPKNITQNTAGAWYGIKEKLGTLVLVEEVKRGSRGLLKMSFNEMDSEFTVEADLSTVDWTADSGYQASYQRCDYLGFSSTEGIVSINGRAVKIPLECKYVSHQTSFTGSDGEDVYAVPAIGYLKSQEVKIPLSLAADLFTAKTFKLSLNIEGVPVGEVKTITLKRSAEETLLAIAKKAESKKNNKNKTMSDIKNKAGKAL